jgi:hypothetical protein
MTRLPCLFLLIYAAAPACTRGAAKDAATASSTAAPGTAGTEVSPPTGASTTPGARAGAPGANAGARVANAGTSPAASECPRTGRWALCSVERRLTQSGFVVRRVDGAPPRRAGFSVLPAVYTLGRSRLEVFIYPSEATLAADVAKIDTVSAAPPGAKNPWPFFSPTFVRSANLAAVFLTDNPTQAERLTLALTAGAPQP